MRARRDIFQAVADPSRRAIIALITLQAMTPNAIAAHFNTSRQAVSKHLQILMECELVTHKQDGRQIYYQVQPGKINEIDNWLNQLRKNLEERFNRLDNYLAKIQHEQQSSQPEKATTPNEPGNIFSISRSFDADAKTLFGMWSNPKRFAGWLTPGGANIWFTSSNFTEGGTAHWTMTTVDEQTKYGYLNFKIINTGHLLVYTLHFCDKDGNFTKASFKDAYPDCVLNTVNFVKEDDNKTRLILKWEIFGEANEKEEQAFINLKPALYNSWSASFDKLQSMLNTNYKRNS